MLLIAPTSNYAKIKCVTLTAKAMQAISEQNFIAKLHIRDRIGNRYSKCCKRRPLEFLAHTQMTRRSFSTMLWHAWQKSFEMVFACMPTEHRKWSNPDSKDFHSIVRAWLDSDDRGSESSTLESDFTKFCAKLLGPRKKSKIVRESAGKLSTENRKFLADIYVKAYQLDVELGNSVLDSTPRKAPSRRHR